MQRGLDEVRRSIAIEQLEPVGYNNHAIERMCRRGYWVDRCARIAISRLIGARSSQN